MTWKRSKMSRLVISILTLNSVLQGRDKMKGCKTIDVAHVVGVVSQYLSNPGRAHGNTSMHMPQAYFKLCMDFNKGKLLLLGSVRKVEKVIKGQRQRK